MHKIILEELKKIEATHHVKVLFAIEAGSRAYHLASPQSDYDVRFVYIRPKEDYLLLNEVRDVIEWKLNDTLDINGWDLQKFLKLMRQSNPSVMEWCASELVYLEREEMSYIKALSSEYFSIKKLLYHYYHMALKNWKSLNQTEEVAVKKYLNIFRPLLTAKWMIHHKTFFVLNFHQLVDDCLDESLKEDMHILIQLKKGNQMYIKSNSAFHIYIEKTLEEVKEAINHFEDKETSWDLLNDAFLKVLDRKPISLFCSLEEIFKKCRLL